MRVLVIFGICLSSEAKLLIAFTSNPLFWSNIGYSTTIGFEEGLSNDDDNEDGDNDGGDGDDPVAYFDDSFRCNDNT